MISVPSTAPAGAAAKSPKEAAIADFLKAQNLQGKVVLIEFGMVGCELSEKGLTSMRDLHKEVKDLAMIRLEGNPDAAAVDAYFKEKNVPFPVVQDKDKAMAIQLSATAIPTFVLVDKFGHIRYTGKYTPDLAGWSKTLLAEKTDPGSQVQPFGTKALDVPKLLEAKLTALDGAGRLEGVHGLRRIDAALCGHRLPLQRQGPQGYAGRFEDACRAQDQQRGH